MSHLFTPDTAKIASRARARKKQQKKLGLVRLVRLVLLVILVILVILVPPLLQKKKYLCSKLLNTHTFS